MKGFTYRRSRIRISCCLVAGGLLSVISCWAETHRVTASKQEWIYGDFRSDLGEAGALRIFAMPGDTVEFRQSDGRRGVFFYRSTRGESELGRAVKVDADFRVIEGPKLERLSNRLFQRENLATPPSERQEIVKIKLGEGFSEPLYFGSNPSSLIGGTNRMFGAIVPAVRRIVQPRMPLPASFAPVGKVGIHRPHRTESVASPIAEESAKVDDLAHFFYNGRIYAVLPGESLAEGQDRSDQWFSSEGNNEDRDALMDADPRIFPWYFETQVDLDGDYDLDWIVCNADADHGYAWRALESNVADRDGLRPEEMGFLPQRGSAAIFPGPPTFSGTSRVFAIPFDYNNDGRPDILIYNGQRNGPLVIMENKRGKYNRKRKAFGFDLRESMTIDLDSFDLETVDLVVPFDADYDGWDDLLIGSEAHDVVILFSRPPRGSSTKKRSLRLKATEGVSEILLEDRDGDGRSDLITNVKGQYKIFYNNGDRTFFNPENR